MATLGQKPATQHVSTEKQTLTGNGGTSYTLQQSVSQAADIEVFVNNTRQEPTVAYTASGNTLTMTGAVNASDSFYVIFQGKAIQTAGLPVDAAITASTITASQSLNVTGHGSFTRGGDTALSLNRETSDGTIVDLQKDGSTVGSIGNAGARLFINSGNVGLNFAGDGSNQILPSNAGVNRDDAITLGTTNVRFKDLYLSGGVYLGGTGSANYLDDYEEGTWTPAIGNITVNSGTWSATGRYVKVGNVVTATMFQNGGNVTWTTSQKLEGLPFTPIAGVYGAGTWTNGSPNTGGQVLVYHSSNSIYFANARSNETELVMTATYVISD